MTLPVQNHPPCNPDPSDAPGCLILESNPIIADDMTAAVRTAGIGTVVCVASTNDVLPALQRLPVALIAFLELSFADLVASGLDKMLEARGVHVVLTAAEDGDTLADARGYSVLQRPFSDDMVHRLIALLGWREG